jgi:GTP-binding protein YchF
LCPSAPFSRHYIEDKNMQLALIGLPGAGVKTIFSAITGLTEATAGFAGGSGPYRVASLKVPDDRLEFISSVIQPKKIVQTSVEIAEFPGAIGQQAGGTVLGKVRLSDALVVVLRSFSSMTVPHTQGSVDPDRDLDDILGELLLSDLAVVESRLERLDVNLKKRKDEDEERERQVLRRCKEQLDGGESLRKLDLLPNDRKVIKGFGFLTRKPVIVLLNIGDAQLGSEEDLTTAFEGKGFNTRALCGDIEAELAQMEESERQEFMTDFGIADLAAPIVLGAAYQTLDLVTFYTHGENEVRAWDVRLGETALDAAGKIHTDIAKGFIRAETISFEDFETYGGVKEVKAHGRFRLEGKEYVVQDGDLIVIRHGG